MDILFKLPQELTYNFNMGYFTNLNKLMNPNSKRRLQLVAGFAVFAFAIMMSYFSVVENESQNILKQDVFLVIDVSGSMLDESKLPFAKTAASEFVDELNLNKTSAHQMGLISFSDGAVLVVNLSENSQEIRRGISSLRADGPTAMGDGISLAIDHLSNGRTDATKTLVLLSDGASNIGSNPHIVALRASSEDIMIFSVGYGYGADVHTLKAISSITNGEYFDAPTGQDLASTFEEIADSLISPASHYSSRVMMLIAIPVLLFIPAIEVGFTTMMGRQDAPVQRNISKQSCLHCKHQNRPTAKFCLKCGKPIAKDGGIK